MEATNRILFRGRGFIVAVISLLYIRSIIAQEADKPRSLNKPLDPIILTI